ncbi:MAG: right-handed parallel beta-helix repeat-containing protein [Candidatus Lokiarchaeota archaeon]
MKITSTNKLYLTLFLGTILLCPLFNLIWIDSYKDQTYQKTYLSNNINIKINPSMYYLNNLTIDGSATGTNANNWSWAVSNPWCSGTGTKTNPYIIQDIIIQNRNFSFRSGILIKYSQAYFEIQNCKIFNCSVNYENSGAAIKFINVTNGIIKNNNISSNFCTGILLINSTYNSIVQNDINNNDINLNLTINGQPYNTSAILLYLSNNNSLVENNLSFNSVGIYCQGTENLLSGNYFSHNKFAGLFVSGEFCKIFNNSFYFSNNGMLAESSYSEIYQNRIINSSSYSIIARNGLHNKIFENSIIHSSNTGILVQNDQSSSFYQNNISNCFNGISFSVDPFSSTGCSGTEVKNNTIKDIKNNGIYI